MSDIVFWVALVGATLAAVLGKVVVNLAVQLVEVQHPALFAELAAKDRAIIRGLSQPQARVRRALAGRMLWGTLPGPLAADPAMQKLRGHFRLLFAGTLAGFACVVAVMVIRAQGAVQSSIG